jgi:hypothetical protein
MAPSSVDSYLYGNVLRDCRETIEHVHVKKWCFVIAKMPDGNQVNPYDRCWDNRSGSPTRPHTTGLPNPDSFCWLRQTSLVRMYWASSDRDASYRIGMGSCSTPMGYCCSWVLVALAVDLVRFSWKCGGIYREAVARACGSDHAGCRRVVSAATRGSEETAVRGVIASKVGWSSPHENAS